MSVMNEFGSHITFTGESLLIRRAALIACNITHPYLIHSIWFGNVRVTSVLVMLCKRCSSRLKRVWLVSILFHLSAVNRDDAALSVIRRCVWCVVLWFDDRRCLAAVGLWWLVLWVWFCPPGADEDCLCVSGCTAYWVPTVMGKLEITLNYGIVISRPWKVMRMSAGYGYIFFLVMLSFRIGKNGASCHTRSSLYVCVFLCHWFISWFQMPSSKPSFKWNIFVNSVITSYFLIII